MNTTSSQSYYSVKLQARELLKIFPMDAQKGLFEKFPMDSNTITLCQNKTQCNKLLDFPNRHLGGTIGDFPSGR